MTMSHEALVDVHPALQALFHELERDDGYVESGANWIEFVADDAYIEAEIKFGEADALRIEAGLLRSDDSQPDEQEVLEWVEKQPPPLPGTSLCDRYRAGGRHHSISTGVEIAGVENAAAIRRAGVCI